MQSFFYRLILFLATILVLLGFTVAFLPAFLNTDFGKGQLESWINRTIPGSIEIKLLDLHWGKGQRIEGVLLRDPDGQSVLEFEKLYTDASLWKLLNKSTRLGFTRIKDLNAAIIIDQNNQSNLQKALGITTSAEPLTVPVTISLSDVQGDFYLTQDATIPFSAHLKGITREAGLIGSFEIDIVLDQLVGKERNDWQEDIHNMLSIEGSKGAKIQATIINFPTDIIDQFLTLKGSKMLLRPIVGEKIDISLDKEPDVKHLAFNLEISAPFLKGNLKGSIENGIFFLNEPSNFSFDITQNSLQYLSNNSLSLIDSAKLDSIIKDFQIPLDFFSNQSEEIDYSFNLEAKINSLRFNFSNSDPIEVKELKASLMTALTEKQLNILATGEAAYINKPFNLKLESQLNKPKNFEELLNHLKEQLKVSINVSQFPLELTPFLKKQPSLLAQTGEKADLNVYLESNQNQMIEGTLSVKTATLQVDKMQFRIDQEFKITRPSQIYWIIEPHAFADIFKIDRPIIDHPTTTRIIIDQFSFPLKNPDKMKMKLETFIEDLAFSDLNSPVKLKIRDLKLVLESNKISEWDSNLTFQALALNQDQSLSPLVNSPIDFKVRGKLKFNSKGKLEIPILKVIANGLDGGAELEGQLTADQVFIFNKPLNIHYLLTPQAFNELLRLFNLSHMPQLINSSLIQLNLAPTPMDFTNDWLSKLMLKGEATVEELIFKDKSLLNFSLKNLHLPLILDARHNLLSISLNGLGFTNLDFKLNSFYMNLKMEDWLQNNRIDLSQSKTEFSSHFIALPTSFVSSLIANQDLTPLLGPSLDIELKTLFDREQQNSGYWDMNIDSTTFHAKARLFLGESITLYESKNPTAILRWTITPTGYEFLKNNYFKTPSSSSLTEPFTVNLHLSSLNFPLSFNASSIEQGQISAHLSTTELKLKDLPPTKLEGEIKSPSLSKSIHLNLRTLAENSSLAIKSVIRDLIDQKGAIRKFEEMNVTLDIRTEQLPIAYFQAFSMLEDTQIENCIALLGENIDATGHVELRKLSGPLELKINGKNGQAQLSGQLESGILTLKTPFNYNLTVTPLLGKSVFKKNISFLSSVIDADNPIKLSIDPQGFSCPLIPFDASNLIIRKGTLEAGKVHFLNQGDLKTLLNYITPISDNRMTIWFTPIYFKLRQGILNLNRFDMLVAHLYPLACWGNFDLNSQNFDLVLGLTAPTLNQAFGVKGLEDNFILQVPLSGRKGQMEINKTKVIGRVSALVAKMKGGEKGKWIGDLLNLVVEDSPELTSPPPSTQPFPWQKELDARFKDSTPLKDTSSSIKKSKKSKKPKKSSPKNKIENNTAPDGGVNR